MCCDSQSPIPCYSWWCHGTTCGLRSVHRLFITMWSPARTLGSVLGRSEQGAFPASCFFIRRPIRR